eukprot:CAMPEP_0206574796 /NCGR_PEP_ID=MMETSP0325_2-20121206/29674_1 /ASSEMBLY_ACC=CAM_ASM_000347 /TAXON_ID=2866 /ORGANISM="Crypthecodinium cohnii, Strain Seligo" /LENGTH=822 /DNA_ID=CAMNT_0054079499 /DNA_START=45 /DNA_END=2517 /DNA_ORIENTATION=-
MAGFCQTGGGGTAYSDDERSLSVPPCVVDVELVSPEFDSEKVATLLRSRTRHGLPLLTRFVSGEEHGNNDTSESSSDESHSSSMSSMSMKMEPLDCKDCLGKVRRRLPFLDWMRRMTPASLQADIFAGLTVCVMVIPQSMSYANIAGLPYVYGMYAACVPTVVYALLGHSRQLAVGPVAMVSLILRAGLHGKLSEEQCPSWYEGGQELSEDQNLLCTKQYVILAVTVSILVGIVELIACVFRLSFLVAFLGHPVISGFSTGSAIIIGCSQLKYFLGIKLPSTDLVHELVVAIAERLGDVKPAPLVLGMLWFAFLFSSKKLARKYRSLKMLGPLSPLLSCVAGILLVWLVPTLREDWHVAHVGTVPGGSIPFTLFELEVSWEQFEKVKTTTISAALIGFMESIAIAKNLAGQHGYSIDAGQELLALGTANVVGSMFACYPVTGSFSRSAVANSTGAQTQFAGIVTGLCMLGVLFFLTPLFYYLPMFALAAIVLNSVISLVAYDVAIELWKVKKWDFLLWFVSFLGTMFIGPLQGIFIAVMMSLGLIIYEAVRPQLTVLWRMPGSNIYRSIELEASGNFVPSVFIVRISSSLYFANASYVQDALMKYLEDMDSLAKTEYLVLECAGVRNLDATACEILMDVVKSFRARGIETAFTAMPARAFRTLSKSHTADFIGGEWFFASTPEAVNACLRHQAARKHAGNGCNPVSMQFHFKKSAAEVSVTNDGYLKQTQVTIGLPRPLPMLALSLHEIFRRMGCDVVHSEVHGVFSRYNLVKNGEPLKAQELEQLQREVSTEVSALLVSAGSPGVASGSSGSPASLQEGTP